MTVQKDAKTGTLIGTKLLWLYIQFMGYGLGFMRTFNGLRIRGCVRMKWTGVEGVKKTLQPLPCRPHAIQMWKEKTQQAVLLAEFAFKVSQKFPQSSLILMGKTMQIGLLFMLTLV